MQLDKVKVGDVFQNYKDMCSRLGMKISQGNSKIAQFKQLEEHFEWRKFGNKIVITNEKKKKDTINENTVESLLLNLLLEHGEILTVSKSYLYKLLHVINSNYTLCRKAPHLLANYLSVDIDNINEFYESTDSMLDRMITKTLQYLQNRFLIDYRKVRMVRVAHASAKLNKDGNIAVDVALWEDEYGIEHVDLQHKGINIIDFHRHATEEENDVIRKYEYEVLQNYGLKSKQELVRHGKWNEWRDSVNLLLREHHNIMYYYDAYEIRAHRKHVENEIKLLDKEEIEATKTIINHGFKQKVLKNAKSRVNRAHNNSVIDQKTLRRTDLNYMDQIREIANHVIDPNQINILSHIKKNSEI
jgi:hypothetical protein